MRIRRTISNFIALLIILYVGYHINVRYDILGDGHVYYKDKHCCCTEGERRMRGMS